MRTDRLELIPLSAESLLALIESEERFLECFGKPAGEGFRAFFTSGEVSPAWLEQLRASRGADPWTHGFALVHQEDGLAVGTVGFKGPPDAEGMVEIAYGVVPAYEGRGYATEAARAGFEFALESDAVRIVRAHTLPTRNASTRVLEKCGFERIGPVDDPEDGHVWRWERSRESA